MKSAKQKLTSLLGFALIAILLTAGCNETNQKVGHLGIVHKGIVTVEPQITISEDQQKKKEVAERMDKQNLLYTSRVVTDKDSKMLEVPANLTQFEGKNFIVAKEAPVVEFGIVPVKPMFLAESPITSKTEVSNDAAPWSNWSQSAFDSKTGKFYSSVGDHGKYDAHILLVEYDPAKKEIKCLPEVNKILGRTKLQFAEGKIHGWLDFYKSNDLQRENLWYCTYWAKYTEPDEEDYQSGYDGGHIMSYDVTTGDIVDYGVPMKRASWPYHRVDTKRGIMYATGMFSEFLVWDINQQKTLWAGYLPDGMKWWVRAIMIDETTGMVYTSNQAQTKDPNMIKYDPYKNRFFQLNCKVPDGQMRAQTRNIGPDGLFYAINYGGTMFTFDPKKEEIVVKNDCWVGEQKYTASMDRSPGGRYVYYCPGAHGAANYDGTPVIQYDTKTDTVKVLAFLSSFYYEKYGYTPSGTFSVKLDDKGEKLFVLWNGAFVDQNALDGDVFGQCSATLINIPESERIE